MEIEDLLQEIDIVEYISQFIDLEQRGDEWWGLSCFKDENTPSFSVRRNPPLFYDYSSGRGGNVYWFVRYYNKCSGKEAVEILKKYLGVDGELSRSPERKKMSTTMVCKKYKQTQKSDKKSKGVVLPDDIMEQYEVRKDKLEVWSAEGMSLDTLNRWQVRYDSFSDRLVYPIRNMAGQIVNIGGRTLDPEWKEKRLRKYTYFYPWGTMDIVFGLYDNMESIRAKREVIIFEGCKSVLIADTWGVHNAACLLTSHLNPNQMKILAKLGCRVVFALDKDVRIRDDKNIQRLKNYVEVEYFWDRGDLLDEKDAPVDKGKEVFLKLYEGRMRYR